jgi:myo-inositol 2-dehydrogenase/D-chiro-inositol 1-dehydrogenase
MKLDFLLLSRVPLYWSFPSRHAQGYVKELDHFLDVVVGTAVVSVTDKMTMAVTKIAEAAEASARSGKPVELTWSADEIPEGYVMQKL